MNGRDEEKSRLIAVGPSLIAYGNMLKIVEVCGWSQLQAVLQMIEVAPAGRIAAIRQI